MIFFRKSIGVLLAILLIVSLPITGCGQKNTQEKAENGLLLVVTSTSIIADVTVNILGDRGRVVYLVPLGESPEDYELIPSQLQKISNADLLLLNGLGLENMIERGLRNVAGTPVVHVAEGVTTIPLVGEDAPDPHAWLDVSNMIIYVENILQALIEIDPAGEKIFRENANSYLEELKILDYWIREQIKLIPEKNRIIVISENALKYYGAAYGFQTEGIWELNSHEEGTPQQIARVVDLVNINQLPGLFVETTVNSRFMETISRETGVPIAGTIYTDALGDTASGADTYINLMKYNTLVFVEGLK